MKDRILKIHASPHKAVLAITGGGSEVIGELLRYGDGSNTLLEAIVPYANASVDNFLHHKPQKYCSAQTAQFMSMSALSRAKMLAPDGCDEKHLIGIGVTCSLVKAGTEREGRQHHVYISTATNDRIRSYNILLAGIEQRARRSREWEEEITAELIEAALAVACNLQDEVLSPSDADVLTTLDTIVLNDIAFSHEKVILAGSFNPLHHRHLAMAQAAYMTLGSPVDFELSVTNVDKPPIETAVVNDRVAKIKEGTKGIGHIGRLYLTNAPKFLEKADLFGPTTFVVGTDTVLRIVKHANIEETVAKLKAAGIKFLVCERIGYDIKTIPAPLAALCTFASPNTYTDDGTSSTKLRENNG